MKTCVGCKHAAWRRTKADKLHPSGEGQCKYEWKMPKLPASMFWVSFDGKAPRPILAHIDRHKTLPDHCVYYEREAK